MFQRKPSSMGRACTQIGLHTAVVSHHNNNKWHAELESWTDNTVLHTT